MDSIVHSALEEICAQGSTGLPLSHLWRRLGPALSARGLSLCPDVKSALWSNLLAVPGLRFEPDHAGSSLEECESADARIVAPEHIRNSFAGIYDIQHSDSKLSDLQRRVLERIALAKKDGITQSDLAKELGIKGNNIFYILQNLKTRGLIVKQSTVIRTKEVCEDDESKSKSVVTTNMIHLRRYSKNLGCQQRFEIVKEDKPPSTKTDTANGNSGGAEAHAVDSSKEDVHVKDFLPLLKAICDKLEKAEDKVLLVSDIKRDLGYSGSGTTGHRAWRNICHRLKDVQVVEEFQAKVDKREVSCLRLLKRFSQKHFDPKSIGNRYDDFDIEQHRKLGKRGEVTQQLVEVPTERQMYDMIEAEGSKGLVFTELCRRLGLCNKQYYARLLNMKERFGMDLGPESCNKGSAYRVWTSRNLKPDTSDAVTSKPEIVLQKNTVPKPLAVIVGTLENSDQIAQGIDDLTTKGDLRVSCDIQNNEIEPVVSNASVVDGKDSTCLNHSHVPSSELRGVPETELQILKASVSNNVLVEKSPDVVSMPRRRRSYQRYPCLTLGAASMQREQHILKMLQEEKFLIKPELHRRLEDLEDKKTMMDRKTLERTLNKLQQEGHCKCIHVSIPVVSNCGSSRTTVVVLHPSIYSVPPEVLGQIHARMRSFEMQVRGKSSRLKGGQNLPELNNVQRLPKSAKLDAVAEQAEVMRANGFVIAKMVRTKLLHIYLWGYLSSSSGGNGSLSSSEHGDDLNHLYSSCKLFDKDAAVKNMPLELFLQIVGSAQKFEDMVEKCRNGLRLCDLPLQDYRSLMNTRATGRLSLLIDTLRRLKLIRLISVGQVEEASKISHATLADALELKPYIEEPVSTFTTRSCFSSDLRPQMRHDFILSSRKAVDDYWNTLEYCYAAANLKSAKLAFPGSAVHEVFFSRSWSSDRVMTADQRAELIKRVISNDPNKKLSINECANIAKDLSLTLEQVLRVYHDKRQQRLSRMQGVLNDKAGETHSLRKSPTSSRKRKRIERLSEGKCTEHVSVGTVGILSSKQSLQRDITDLMDRTEDENEPEKEENVQEEDGNDDSFIHKYALSRLKSARERKFSWTEKADRQLVIEYARHRASLGANVHRVNWASLPNLPAPPKTCKRRMGVLKCDKQIRRAIMRLCNMLSERYVKHLEKFQLKSIKNGDCKMMVEHLSSDDTSHVSSDSSKVAEEFDSGEQWDNFDDNNLMIAIDDVLRFRRMAKFDGSRGVHSESNSNVFAEGHDAECGDGRSRNMSKKSVSRRIPRKYIKLSKGGVNISRTVHESVAVSNAVELFKLIFLTSSTAPEVSSLLAQTLRRYSEHDLLAAFSYLRDNKVLIGGLANNPFVLSQHFFRNISKSPFPPNTCKRADKFATWLCEKEEDLMEDGIDLPEDLQCGDLFHLSALLSLGELSVTPTLPDEGVGEAEDSRTDKRKYDSGDFSDGENSKKLRYSLPCEGETTCRRIKGFPGIRLSLNYATKPRIHYLDSCRAIDTPKSREQHPVSATSGRGIDGFVSNPEDFNNMEEILVTGKSSPAVVSSGVSPWETMSSYANHLYVSLVQECDHPFNAELFRTVYASIQKSGDQGLSVEEITSIVNICGERMIETVVEVLETFKLALKVNTYDSVHVINSLYRSKYCLTSMVDIHQNSKATRRDTIRRWDDERLIHLAESDEYNADQQKEMSLDTDLEHRVTILNMPHDVLEPSGEMQSSSATGDYSCSNVPTVQEPDKFQFQFCESHLCRPILPWINGDGTINQLVYKGLRRRIIGIVMQNPGIQEEEIINRMRVLNPQSCRTLLHEMLLENHIIVRKMQQATSDGPPAILGGLIGSLYKKPKPIWRKHLFANPMSTTLL